MNALRKPKGCFSAGTFVVQFAIILVVRIVVRFLMDHKGARAEDFVIADLYGFGMGTLPVRWAAYALDRRMSKGRKRGGETDDGGGEPAVSLRSRCRRGTHYCATRTRRYAL